MNIRAWAGIGAAGVAACAMAQQSNNNELHAVPPPKGKVTIDGALDDWDLSGQIEIFANYRTRNTYSAKVAAMWDSDHLYLCIQWRDPTPLQNYVDADFEVGSGWKSDCVQLRLFTDLPVHADCWYSTAAQKSVLNIQYGSFDDKSDLHESKFKSTTPPNAIAAGAQQAFKVGEDGKSYVQEIAFPWRLITGQAVRMKDSGAAFGEPVTYKAGSRLRMGIELLWGGADGRTWPIHRYADLLQKGTSSREFFWMADKVWGSVILEPKGNLKLPAPDYTERSTLFQQRGEGPVALAYTMPYDGFATVVVEDGNGIRVKNLIGMAERAKGRQTEYWDCTDEKGQLVPPGPYRFRGLTHQGIEPVYEATYGTPGTPPWDTGDGTGAWMSDHKAPRAVATHGDHVVLGAEEGESGYAIIGATLDGRKLWGDRTLHGVQTLAADAGHAYVYLGGWNAKQTIARLELRSGKYAPFETPDRGPQLQVGVFAEGEKTVWIPNFAVGPEHIAVPIPRGENGEQSALRFFDKKTMARVKELPLPGAGIVAYAPDGKLYVWVGAAGQAQVCAVEDGKVTPLIANGLPEWGDGMTVDAKGNIYIVHKKGNVVKMFSPRGDLVRTIGKPGGRPPQGTWDPAGMLNPVSAAVDSGGALWVTEEHSSPKRVSVWSTADGTFLRDYIGPTGYGGTGACADPDDKTRVFGSECEWSLDYDTNTATVKTALGIGGWLQFKRINGREYFMAKNGRLYLHEDNTIRLVAAIGNFGVKDVKECRGIALPEIPGDLHGYASFSFVWSDLNDNGVSDPDEVAVGSSWWKWEKLKHPIGTSGYFGSYWLDDTFAIVGMAGESYGGWGGRPPMVTRIPLKGWTPKGAPIWDLEAHEMWSDKGRVSGSCLFYAENGRIVAGEPMQCVRRDGTIEWTYPNGWSGVHGSHAAPIPVRDDTLIGVLGCIGTVKTSLGTVFGLHSNMGRLGLLTMDGLFVANVFQDTRLGSEPWPASAQKGAPLGGVTMGSEWFGGHLFQSSKDNAAYLIAGFTAYNLIRLNGFETLRPIAAQNIKVSAADLKKAEEMARKRAVAKNQPKQTTLHKMAAPAIDGKLDEFAEGTFVAWQSGPYNAKASVGYDDNNLYLAYEVKGDSNPMVNGGKDVTHLFVTGDSVDLQLGTDASAKPGRADPVVGDLRLLISVLDNKPVAVLYRWKVKGARKPVTFKCPWRDIELDYVEVVENAEIAIDRFGEGYRVEAKIPLAALAFSPEPGKQYKMDLGVIYSDAKGDNRAARVYWSNQATGLVADIPGEIMGNPNLWGTATVAP